MKIFAHRFKFFDGVAVLVFCVTYLNTAALEQKQVEDKSSLSEVLQQLALLRNRRATTGHFSRNHRVKGGQMNVNNIQDRSRSRRNWRPSPSGQTRSITATITRKQRRTDGNEVRRIAQPFVDKRRSSIQASPQNIVVRKLLPDGKVGDVINNIGDQVDHMKSGIQNIFRKRITKQKGQNNIQQSGKYRHRLKNNRNSFSNSRQRHSIKLRTRKLDISRKSQGNSHAKIRKGHHDRMIRVGQIRNNFGFHSNIPHINMNINRMQLGRRNANSGNLAGDWKISQFQLNQDHQNNMNNRRNGGILGGSRFHISSDVSNKNFNSNGRLRLGGIPSGIIGGTGFPGAGFVFNNDRGNINTNRNTGDNNSRSRNRLLRVNRVRQIKPQTKIRIVGPRQKTVNQDPEMDTEISNVIGLASRVPSVNSQEISLQSSPNTIVIPGLEPVPYFDPILPFLLDVESDMFQQFFPVESHPQIVVPHESSNQQTQSTQGTQNTAHISSNPKTKTIYVQNGDVVQLSPADIGVNQVIRIVNNNNNPRIQTPKWRTLEEPEVEKEETAKTTTTTKAPKVTKSVSKAVTTTLAS